MGQAILIVQQLAMISYGALPKLMMKRIQLRTNGEIVYIVDRVTSLEQLSLAEFSGE